MRLRVIVRIAIEIPIRFILITQGFWDQVNGGAWGERKSSLYDEEEYHCPDRVPW